MVAGGGAEGKEHDDDGGVQRLAQTNVRTPALPLRKRFGSQQVKVGLLFPASNETPSLLGEPSDVTLEYAFPLSPLQSTPLSRQVASPLPFPTPSSPHSSSRRSVRSSPSTSAAAESSRIRRPGATASLPSATLTHARRARLRALHGGDSSLRAGRRRSRGTAAAPSPGELARRFVVSEARSSSQVRQMSPPSCSPPSPTFQSILSALPWSLSSAAVVTRPVDICFDYHGRVPRLGGRGALLGAIRHC